METSPKYTIAFFLHDCYSYVVMGVSMFCVSKACSRRPFVLTTLSPTSLERKERRSFANYYTPDDTMYGWAEVALDENGVLYAVNSMTDLTGASVIVGDIPEPSSALLLLLGAAALSLRRRHVNLARAV